MKVKAISIVSSIAIILSNSISLETVGFAKADVTINEVTDFENFPKIKNPSFETGDLSYWQTNKEGMFNVVGTAQKDSNTITAANGEYFVEVTPDGEGDGILYQEIDAIQNINYMFNAGWYDISESNASFKVYGDSISENNLLMSVSGFTTGWFNATKVFNSGEHKKLIVTVSDCTSPDKIGKKYWIDNITVAPFYKTANYGFESGDISGIATNTSAPVVSYTEEDVYSGNGALKVQTGDTEALIYVPYAFPEASEAVQGIDFQTKIVSGKLQLCTAWQGKNTWNEFAQKDYFFNPSSAGCNLSADNTWKTIKLHNFMMGLQYSKNPSSKMYVLAIRVHPNTTAYIDDILFQPYTGIINSLTITGENRENGELNVNATAYTYVGAETYSCFSYQWQNSDDGIVWHDISGATDNSYTITIDDSDKYIRVKACTNISFRTENSEPYYSKPVKVDKIMPSYEFSEVNSAFEKTVICNIGDNCVVNNADDIKNLEISGSNKDDYTVELFYNDGKVTGFGIKYVNDFSNDEKKISIKNALHNIEKDIDLNIDYSFKLDSCIEVSDLIYKSKTEELKNFTVFKGVFDENDKLISYEISKADNGIALLERNVIANENEKVKTIVFDDENRVLYVDVLDEVSEDEFEKGLSIDRKTSQMTLNTDADGIKSNAPVLVTVMCNDSIIDIKALKTGNNSNISIKSNLDISQTGTYKIVVGGFGMEKVKEFETNIYSDEIYEEMISKINGEDADGNTQSMTEEDGEKLFDIFGLNSEFKSKINISKLVVLINSDNSKVMSEDIYDKVSDAKKILEKLTVIEMLNESSNDISDENGKIKYAKELEIENTDENDVTLYKLYNEILSSDGIKALISDISGKNIKSAEEFEELFKSSAILNLIAYPNVGGTGYISNILTAENLSAVGIENSQYFNRIQSEKNKIIEGLVKKKFNSISELEKELNKKPTITETSSVGGSSSNNGSSSNVKKASSVISGSVLPSANESITETDNIIFDDVSDEHWAYKYIYALNQINVINGVGENKFDPEGYVTREQFVKILCSAFKLKMGEKDVSFADCEAGAWYEQYVKTAASNDIVKGIDNENFGVGMPVTREDLCVMALRVLNPNVTNNEMDFEDSDSISDYAMEAVGTLSMLKIISGFEDGTFRPKEKCTRAQASKIIYEIMNIKEEVR